MNELLGVLMGANATLFVFLIARYIALGKSIRAAQLMATIGDEDVPFTDTPVVMVNVNHWGPVTVPYEGEVRTAHRRLQNVTAYFAAHQMNIAADQLEIERLKRLERGDR